MQITTPVPIAPRVDSKQLNIPLTPVNSSQLKAVGYDAATKTLAVQFNKGAAIYAYGDIEPVTYDEFMAAKSAGVFFAQHISGRPFEKLTPEPKADDQST